MSELQVSVVERSLPLARPFAIARGTITAERVVAVTIERDGVVGRGEATPVKYLGETAAAAVAALRRGARELLGGDVPDHATIGDRALAAGLPRCAAAALDAAVHDWAGRRRGVPVWRLLGIAAPDGAPTSFTVGLDDPAGTVARLAEARAFRVLKVKAGGADDLERLALVRGRTDVPLRVDANGGWDLSRALTLLPALAELGVELVEQPFAAGDVDAYAALRAHGSPLPIYADESCLDAAGVPAVAGLVDGVVVKLAKTGGIAGARRQFAAAREHGLATMLGCMVGSELGIAAAVQLAALADHVDLDGHLLLAAPHYAGLALAGGAVVVGDAPGLGVTPLDSRL